MNIARAALLVSTMTAFSPATFAGQLINEMQSCQGLLDFVSIKLDSGAAKYTPADVSAVRLGLKQYDDYIQSAIVTPGLIKFNNGDSAKATTMQIQVDAYKTSIVAGLSARYPENRLYTDQAIAINNCAMKAVPSGQALENLKVALHKIIELAKLN